MPLGALPVWSVPTAAVADIAMAEHEVNLGIKAFQANNLEVVAVHNHVLFDQPRMMFLRYHGCGPAAPLATDLRAVLDQFGKGYPARMGA